MNHRAADKDMKNLYGGGIEELLSQKMREDNEASLPTMDEADYPVMEMKHKKQAALLRDILKHGGYGDLAKQVSIRRGG